MPQFAYLESGSILDERRRSPRKRLRLNASGASASGDPTQVIVLDISETGMLLESSQTLTQGEELDVVMPNLAPRRLTVVWARGRFFGCHGQARLSELGLYYCKPRICSAVLGRFLQTDRVGYAPVSASKRSSSASITKSDQNGA